jgi:hypothetical protein
MADQLTMHVALVSEIDEATLSTTELTQVSAAVSKQVARDFGPIWGVNATVDAFGSLDDVPAGYWPVIVQKDIGDPSAAGYHTDKDGNPFALVQHSSSWSLTASHETLEMLADPFGNRTIACPSPWGPDKGKRVEILVEVCDPVEDIAFAYSLNGVTVSDFYTPRYFDATGAAGAQYSFTDHVKKPRQLLKGGYISYHDLSTDHWMQIQFFDAKPTRRDLGKITAKGGLSIREQVDAMTYVEPLVKGYPRSSKVLTEARSMTRSVTSSSSAKAAAWRTQIRELTTVKSKT